MSKVTNIRYNIRLNIRTIQNIFKYFHMDEKNTLFELVTQNDKLIDELNSIKSNIVKVKENKKSKSIYIKNIKFEKLVYFFSKHVAFNIYCYKKYTNIDMLSHKLSNNIESNNSEVCIHIKMDTISDIVFNNEKYDVMKARQFLRPYRTINVEYIVLFILLIIGILIRVLR